MKVKKMNKEIKEILEHLKRIANQETLPPEISEDEAREILDYITNLQEQNDFARKLTLKETKKAIGHKSRIDKAIEYIKTFSGESNNFCLDYLQFYLFLVD